MKKEEITSRPYYTHAGLFHADEVVGYVICKLAKQADLLVRVTDLDNIPTGGIAADIGRRHNPLLNLFDHHQGLLLREDGYPYASAGLLWEEFGGIAIVQTVGSTKHINEVWRDVLQGFIKGIDANDADNAYRVTAECSAGFVKVNTLPEIIDAFNCPDVNDHEAQYINFIDACDLIERLLVGKIRKALRYHTIMDNWEDKVTFTTPEIVQLSEGFPWKKAIDTHYPAVKFVIAPSNHPGSKFSLTAVTVTPHTRECKISIERPTWFEDFIHQGKWIAGSNDPALLFELAKYNIDLYNQNNIF